MNPIYNQTIKSIVAYDRNTNGIQNKRKLPISEFRPLENKPHVKTQLPNSDSVGTGFRQYI